LKRHTLIGCFACTLSMTPFLRGQAIPAASRIDAIQIGVGGTLTNPDFGQKNIEQITFFADCNLAHNLGVEGVIHYTVNSPTNVIENSYMAGARYIVRRKRFEPYGKVLFGLAHFGLQSGSLVNSNTGTYFGYVLGGGLDIHATRRINVRAFDFEAQQWPGFATHALTPFSGTIGVAYVFR
jgi:opacity protein-like surface antigen